MEDIAAHRLNELFKRWTSGNKRIRPELKLIHSDLMMTFTTATGSKVSIHPSTPHDAASYLRRFMRNDDPLFVPGDVRCDSPTESRSRPGSILFKGFGFVRDNANYERYRMMLHMKFTGVAQLANHIGDPDTRGLVSFHDHFSDDAEEPLHTLSGPSIHEFIRILESAGNEWSKMHFRTANTHLNAGHMPMQLIKTK